MPQEFFGSIPDVVKEITVYTDGACLRNPGPGGWGAVLLSGDNKLTLSGSEALTTNNRMEMMAAVEAFNCIKKYAPHLNITLYTDSKYLKDGTQSWMKKWKINNWMTATKKPVKNQDLWEMIDAHMAHFSVEWKWVKGHSGDTYNEEADTLASQAIVAQQIAG